jgi:hypothetical protein
MARREYFKHAGQEVKAYRIMVKLSEKKKTRTEAATRKALDHGNCRGSACTVPWRLDSAVRLPRETPSQKFKDGENEVP